MSAAAKTYFSIPNGIVNDKDLKAAREKIITARVKLIFHHAFFGQLALRLTLVPADPEKLSTAATDGRHIYYNPHFINKLDVEETVFVVAHELGHCVFEHMIRSGGRDPALWNIAGDYLINSMIDDELVHGGNPCARIITTIKPFLNHKKFSHKEWSAEEVYDVLFDEQQNGKDHGKDGELVDVHIDVSGSGSGEEGDDGDGNVIFGGGLTDEERKELENDLRDAIIQAAQNGGGAGNIPAGIRRMIKDLVEPQMDWREIIQAQIESSIKSNYSWLRPNRKGWHMSAVLPGMVNDFKIDVCLAIDTSGSISQQMLIEFVSEIAGIMGQYEDYRIRLWQFDTKVYGYDEFTSDDGRDISEYEISGGGGTNFMCNWHFMVEKEIEPDQFIMFTDGMPCDAWGDPDYCDTVFLINTYYGRPEAPFGMTVYFDDHERKNQNLAFNDLAENCYVEDWNKINGIG